MKVKLMIHASNEEGFIRTDLAVESISERDYDACGYKRCERGGAVIESLHSVSGGHYATITIGALSLMSDEELDKLRLTIADEIRAFTAPLRTREGCILVAGLGNRFITPDSLGPRCVDKLLITRHLESADQRIFASLSHRSVCALTPGVTGQTGIETLELIRAAAATVRPAMIIAIDALAARSTERLARTVQITNEGISPGSGIGNDRGALNRETLGAPVIAIGVPTVIDSSTMISDALERCCMTEYPDELQTLLENGRSFFVSPKDSDIVVDELSSLISGALNLALSLSE